MHLYKNLFLKFLFLILLKKDSIFLLLKIIVSNYCDLGHNLVANDYFTAMPSVIIGGNCEIGESTLIGSGAKIHQGLKIGKNSKIGMGTIVTSDVRDNSLVIDHPRKAIKEIK